MSLRPHRFRFSACFIRGCVLLEAKLWIQSIVSVHMCTWFFSDGETSKELVL